MVGEVVSHRLFNFILGKLNFISNTALIIDAINGTIFMCPGLDCLVSDHPKYVELKDLRDVVELPPHKINSVKILIILDSYYY